MTETDAEQDARWRSEEEEAHDRMIGDMRANLRDAVEGMSQGLHLFEVSHRESVRLYDVEIVEDRTAERVIPASVAQIEMALAALDSVLPPKPDDLLPQRPNHG